jgi:hypothetical protein
MNFAQGTQSSQRSGPSRLDPVHPAPMTLARTLAALPLLAACAAPPDQLGRSTAVDPSGFVPDSAYPTVTLGGIEFGRIRPVDIVYRESAPGCETSAVIGLYSEGFDDDGDQLVVEAAFDDWPEGTYDAASALYLVLETGGFRYYSTTGSFGLDVGLSHEDVTIAFDGLALESQDTADALVLDDTLTLDVGTVGCAVLVDGDGCTWEADTRPYRTDFCLDATARWPDDVF